MRRKFLVTFIQFPQTSDMTTVQEVWAKDEDDCAKVAASMYPLWEVKSIVRAIS